MRTLSLRAALAVAVTFAAPATGTRIVAQDAWVLQSLQAYADGRQADAAEKLRSIGSLRQFQDDLDQLAPKWLDVKGDAAERHRRAIIAFALEAAIVHLDQASEASKLAEWSCRQVRRHSKPDDFDHLVQMTVFAILAGAVDPDALEAHVTHVKFQFPTEPRLALERGLAEELRAAPFYEPAKQVPGDVVKHREEAARRYAEAAKNPATLAEASLRLGRVQLDLGKPTEALKALEAVEPATKETALWYLARLFRGLACDRLKQPAEAARAYEQALALRPQAQSAEISLAALAFRQADRQRADQLAHDLLSRQTPGDDPWWAYWPGDYRLGSELIRTLREGVQ